MIYFTYETLYFQHYIFMSKKKSCYLWPPLLVRFRHCEMHPKFSFALKHRVKWSFVNLNLNLHFLNWISINYYVLFHILFVSSLNFEIQFIWKYNLIFLIWILFSTFCRRIFLYLFTFFSSAVPTVNCYMLRFLERFWERW